MKAEEREDEQPPRLSEDLRALLAEIFGTFALTMVGAGAIVFAEISNKELSYVARVVAPGLTVMAMIYSIGEVSGAHINPVVTLAFALRRSFAWRRVPGYWIAQLLGALLAAGLLRLLFGDVGHVGATLPKHGDLQAFVMEIILTLFLVTVIIGTAKGSKVVGPNAGIAVGATIAFCGMFADPISGASMNPARSLGPAIVGGELGTAWIYILGPLIGAVLAVLLTLALKGAPDAHETEAASGKGDKPSGAEGRQQTPSREQTRTETS